MADVGLAELSAILQEIAGDIGGDSVGVADLDTSLQELGCDSLAVLELAVRVKQRYKVVIPDEQATGELTPRDLLDLVNNGLPVI
jgi:act minimal PKS acyl carrier protein